jgi:hypothetical protein
MMKTKSKYTTAMILVILFSVSSCFSMRGGVEREKRDVGKFDRIGLGVSADLYLKQGNTTEVIIEANEEILEKLKTEVTNGKLIIKFDPWRFSNYPRFKIFITTPVINELGVSGSGDIIAESAIQTDEIVLRISGSGEITIDDLKANDLNAGISGSGNINLAGSQSLNILDLSISGSGDFNAAKLATEDFTGRISGSGSCRVHVNSTLKASISGSGKIFYSGNPMIDASISGSGKVISQ